MLRFLIIKTPSKCKVFHVFSKNPYTLYSEKAAKTLVKSGIFAYSASPNYLEVMSLGIDEGITSSCHLSLLRHIDLIVA